MNLKAEEVPCLLYTSGQKSRCLLQFHIAVGELSNGSLGRQGLAVGLGAQRGKQPGRSGIDPFLKGGVQLAYRGGEDVYKRQRWRRRGL